MNKYRKNSLRQQSWNYSFPGYYFVTICLKNREDVYGFPLGQVINGEVKLSEIGKIAKKYWLDLPNHYANMELDEYVIMPDHIHGIIVINEANRIYHKIGAIHELPLFYKQKNHQPHNYYRINRRRMLLSKIMGRFKMRTAKEINLLRNKPGWPFWQRNYYDHVIKNQTELDRIRQYILGNPLKWEFNKVKIENNIS